MADTQNIYENEKKENNGRRDIRRNSKMGGRPQKNRMSRKNYDRKKPSDAKSNNAAGTVKSENSLKNSRNTNRQSNVGAYERRDNISALNELRRNTKLTKNLKKMPEDKETAEHILTEFILGECEDNGKKLAFKKCVDEYKIIDITYEEEKVINTYKESAQAYLEWCKIKYPDKVKKNLV